MKSVANFGMTRLLPIALAASAAFSVLACDTATSPGIGRLLGPDTLTHDTTSSTAQLVVNPSFVQLAAASTVQLSTNAPGNLSSQVRWTSLQPTIASVSQTGLVTTLVAGTATIVARYTFDTANVAAATVLVTPIGGGTP
jgi:hypothetical protein